MTTFTGGTLKCVCCQWKANEEISSRLKWSGMLFESVHSGFSVAWRWQEGGFDGTDDKETTSIGQEGWRHCFSTVQLWSCPWDSDLKQSASQMAQN